MMLIFIGYCVSQFLILVPPRIVPFSFEEPIFSGQSIQVSCSITEGDSPIQIHWKLSGADIPENFGIEVQSVGRRGSVLIFDSADSRHGGNYTCSATNAAGTVHYTAILNVHGNLSILCGSSLQFIVVAFSVF